MKVGKIKFERIKGFTNMTYYGVIYQRERDRQEEREREN